ncbi:hypothetical protein NDN94_07820 [Burkholderia glumae]|uniref:hypothetical protein n=1 Tax=Burkholderia glumae TaxID=337 RepID=UPI002037662D|nr:hypothetical protein [Burkholderia glumae]MCM2537735.1 hypothetical protein [Burkholderia glumae]
MNRDILNKILDHLHVQTVYPTKIDAKAAPWFDRRQRFDSFLRINWDVSEISAAEILFDKNGTPETVHFLKFIASTRTRIVRMGESGIPKNSEEPNDEDVALDVKVDFAVEYTVTGCKPEDLPEDGMSEFATHNMPYHLWPYYRQTVQDIATRMQFQTPAIPSFRVPASHQSKSD